MMPKKSSDPWIVDFFGELRNFLGVRDRKILFTKSGHFLLLLKKIKISATPDPPNRRWGAILNRGPPKCCQIKWCCRGPSHRPIKHSNAKKRRFGEILSLKQLPIDDLGGRVLPKFLILKQQQKVPTFCKKIFFYLSPPKSYRAHQKNYQNLSWKIFWHH